MAEIALFPSVLGVRPGVLDAAEVLRGAGHVVHVIDQHDGKVFDDYDEAMAYTDSIGGIPTLMSRAEAATDPLADGFVPAGFSQGSGAAEYIGVKRPVSAVLLFAGALPVSMMGVDAWPSGVPVQIHQTIDDPWRDEGYAESLAESVRAGGATCDVFDYPGSGHLFTDASKTDEFQPDEAALMWQRVLAFLEGLTH